MKSAWHLLKFDNRALRWHCKIWILKLFKAKLFCKTKVCCFFDQNINLNYSDVLTAFIMLLIDLLSVVSRLKVYMGQGFQEWTMYNFLKAVFHKFCLAHFWISWSIGLSYNFNLDSDNYLFLQETVLARRIMFLVLWSRYQWSVLKEIS